MNISERDERAFNDFIGGRTYRQLAEELDVSQERVKQIIVRIAKHRGFVPEFCWSIRAIREHFA